MSFLKGLKANKPVASLEGYFIAMLAKSKFGKTTFAIDLAKEFYGTLDSTLLLATEVGYKTMNGVFAIPITGFDYAEDEDDEEQKGFIEVVDELVENKNDIPFKFIIIDTITALERYATHYVVAQANINDAPSPRYSDISDVPWGKGYNMLAEAIYEQIDRLKKNGFGVFIIGHEKNKKVKNRDGFEYDYTTFNVQTKTSDIIEREADMIIYGDLRVVKDKSKAKSKSEKGEGKDKEEKKVGKTKTKTERKLLFRSDGNILAGTRFRNFPDELDSDVHLFIEEFNSAVLGLYNDDSKALGEARKEQDEQRQKKGNSTNAKENKEKELEHIKTEISNHLKEMDNDRKIEMAQRFKEVLGKKDYRKSDDVEGLQEILTELE